MGKDSRYDYLVIQPILIQSNESVTKWYSAETGEVVVLPEPEYK